jgi:diguanylate cyclase (GGDEF)-like protein
MTNHLRLNTLASLALGSDAHRRRHVLLLLRSLLPYSISVVVILHSWYLKLLPDDVAHWLLTGCLLTFVLMFGLVRSGWSARYADPVLTYPHALITIVLVLAAYATVGAQRADTLILVAQTIVLAMFRLKPSQVLSLGIVATALLGACILGLTLMAPTRYAPASGWAHFVVAGSTLLLLSLVGKWISDIRVRIGRQARELEEAVRTVQQMATTDMLTGALNRRMLTELTEAEMKLSERSGAPLCVALIDLDHFKHINDQHGHAAGDVVLKALTQTAHTQLRQVDKFGRWGGEEFLLMLPRIVERDAHAAVERLRLVIESLHYNEVPGLRVTFSSGVAQYQPGESIERLIERADEALYEAKQSGRNRVHLASCRIAPTSPADEVLS